MESDHSHVEVSKTVRDVHPKHYILRLESFSLLCESGIEKYESDDFEADGFKWKLHFYPKGNKARNVDTQISLYLALVDTKGFSPGWEINVRVKFFLYDHLRDNYTTIEDKRSKRFSWMKTEWGFDKLLALDMFKESTNGYLFDDNCVIGAEVFVIRNADKVDCLSMVKKPQKKTHTWKIDHFSDIRDEIVYSEEFYVEEVKWKIQLYPKGNGEEKNKSVGLYLNVCKDNPCLLPKWRFYVRYNLRIRNQINTEHSNIRDSDWFFDTAMGWGYSKFMLLSELKDTSKGFVVDGSLIVEADVEIIAVTKNISAKSVK